MALSSREAGPISEPAINSSGNHRFSSAAATCVGAAWVFMTVKQQIDHLAFSLKGKRGKETEKGEDKSKEKGGGREKEGAEVSLELPRF